MKEQYVYTADLGKSNMHAAVYAVSPGSGTLPVAVGNIPDVKNRNYEAARDKLLIERIDFAAGLVVGNLVSQPEEVRNNLAAIFIDGHGAPCVVLDKKGNPLFPLDYDHEKVDEYRTKFHMICGSQDALYDETSSPQIGAGINWLVSLGYLLDRFPEDMKKHAGQVTSMTGYPAQLLTGQKVLVDSTMIFNHGYAGNVHTGQLSSAVQKLSEFYGIDLPGLIGGFRRQSYIPVGVIGENSFGFPKNTPVFVVMHDTSLVSELARIARFDSFDNSGTWSCLISPGRNVRLQRHMQRMDFTINRDIYDQPLPTCMFRGGEMWEGYMGLAGLTVKHDPLFDAKIFAEILAGNDFIMPAFMGGNGPYKHDPKKTPRIPDGLTDPVRLAHAVHLALAIQTMYAEAAAHTDLAENASIADILQNPSGEKMLLAGPASRGLSAEVLRRVNPKATYALREPTPVNLTGALVAMAYMEGKRPDQLEVAVPDKVMEDITPNEDRVTLETIIQYAKRWETAVRSEA
jgi:hypothetical protein